MSVCYVPFLLKIRTITFDLSCFRRSGVHMFVPEMAENCRKASTYAGPSSPRSNRHISARLQVVQSRLQDYYDSPHLSPPVFASPHESR